ncbi:MAG: hypothetical protein ACYDGR_07725 [Candidatus Dormibacteria bacterium]
MAKEREGFSAVKGRGWPTTTLVSRANKWASGRPRVRALTEATLLEWRQQDLVQRPRARGLGRGKGTAQEWPTAAYRNILLLMRLQAEGISDNRARRFFLWLRGARLADGRLPADMAAVFERAITDLNREQRSDRWGANEGSAPTPNATAAIGKTALSKEAWTRTLSLWGLSGRSEPYEARLISLLANPLFARTLIGLVYGLFVPSAESMGAGLSVIRRAVPKEWAEAIPTDLLKAQIGVLADPELFADNPLLRAVASVDVETIENLRAFTDAYNDFAAATGRLAAAVLETDGEELLGRWAMTAPLLTSAIRTMASSRPVRTPAHKVVVMALMMMRPQNEADRARPLRTLAEFTPAIGWAADNWAELRATGGDEAEVRGLLGKAILPIRTREVLAELGVADTNRPSGALPASREPMRPL